MPMDGVNPFGDPAAPAVPPAGGNPFGDPAAPTAASSPAVMAKALASGQGDQPSVSDVQGSAQTTATPTAPPIQSSPTQNGGTAQPAQASAPAATTGQPPTPSNPHDAAAQQAMTPPDLSQSAIPPPVSPNPAPPPVPPAPPPTDPQTFQRFAAQDAPDQIVHPDFSGVQGGVVQDFSQVRGTPAGFLGTLQDINQGAAAGVKSVGDYVGRVSDSASDPATLRTMPSAANEAVWRGLNNAAIGIGGAAESVADVTPQNDPAMLHPIQRVLDPLIAKGGKALADWAEQNSKEHEAAQTSAVREMLSRNDNIAGLTAHIGSLGTQLIAIAASGGPVSKGVSYVAGRTLMQAAAENTARGALARELLLKQSAMVAGGVNTSAQVVNVAGMNAYEVGAHISDMTPDEYASQSPVNATKMQMAKTPEAQRQQIEFTAAVAAHKTFLTSLMVGVVASRIHSEVNPVSAAALSGGVFGYGNTVATNQGLREADPDQPLTKGALVQGAFWGTVQGLGTALHGDYEPANIDNGAVRNAAAKKALRLRTEAAMGNKSPDEREAMLKQADVIQAHLANNRFVDAGHAAGLTPNDIEATPDKRSPVEAVQEASKDIIKNYINAAQGQQQNQRVQQVRSIQLWAGMDGGRTPLEVQAVLHQLVHDEKLPDYIKEVSDEQAQGRQGANEGKPAENRAGEGNAPTEGRPESAAPAGADTDGQESGQAGEVSPRAAAVSAKLAEQGVAAPVAPDGRVRIEPGEQAETALEAAAHDAAESPHNDYLPPTDGQKAGGNYRKGKTLFPSPHGDIRVNIENPAGSIRKSMPGFPKWERKVSEHYGYLPGTHGADGDPLDVLVGRQSSDDTLPLFVVHQTDPDTGKFDELKVVMGAKSEGQAKQMYLNQYPRALHDKLVAGTPKITRFSRQQFTDWLAAGDHATPVSPISKRPMLALQQRGQLNAHFGPAADYDALDTKADSLNSRLGVQLSVNNRGDGGGYTVSGDTPKALIPAIHRALKGLPDHEETTYNGADASQVFPSLGADRGERVHGEAGRAGLRESGERTGRQQRALAEGGNRQEGQGSQKEAPPPRWLTKPESDAPIYQRAQGKRPVSVVGVHYSAEHGLTELDPAQSGRSVPERGRLLRAAGENAPALEQRVHFYVRTGEALPEKERIVGGASPAAYETRLNNLYDVQADPDHIIERAALAGHGANHDAIVRAILRAGYDGTVHAGVANDTPVATLFGKGKVPVKPVGDSVSGRLEKITGVKADSDGVILDRAAFDKAVKQYSQIPETRGGKVLSADVARELSPDYLKNRTLSADTHPVASSFVKALYREKLAQPHADNAEVAFTAGGTGAGKTSALQRSSAFDAADMVFDTNLDHYDSALRKINQALDSGRDVHVFYVYRDPVDAMRNGALVRATRQEREYGSGRTVPIDAHVKTHVEVLGTMRRLAEHFKGDDRFHLTAIDNSHGRGNAVETSLDKLKDFQYDRVKTDVTHSINEAYNHGEISYRTRQGFLGEKSGTDQAGEAQARRQGVRGQPQSEREGGRADQVAQEARYTFAGVKAKTADMEALAKAKADHLAALTGENEIPHRDIDAVLHHKYGWSKGHDGKWRFEISDHDAELNYKLSDIKEATYSLYALMKHDTLFEAYPWLKKIEVKTDGNIGRGAGTNPANGNIEIGLPKDFDDEGTSSWKSVLQHEVQHVIQLHERFAVGGNPDALAGPILQLAYEMHSRLQEITADYKLARSKGDTATMASLKAEGDKLIQRLKDKHLHNEESFDKKVFNRYEALTGETEARNTQTRMRLTPEERRLRPPESTEDVPRSEQYPTFHRGDSSLPDMRSTQRKKVTDTPAFRKWFGDSKVVDAKGEPVVMYHGTDKSFDSFDESKSGANFTGDYGNGFYFTQNPKLASRYADSAGHLNKQDGENVMPVHLALKNPKVVDGPFADGDLWKSVPDARTREELTAGLKSQGYDGVLVKDHDFIREAVAFRPEQIKSASGNSGTFDASNPDIRYDLGDGAHLATELAPNPDDVAATKAWESLSPEDRADATRDIGNDAVHQVADLLGISHGAIDNAFGGFEGTVNPNILTHYNAKKVSLDDARSLASGIGRALGQKSVALIDARAAERHPVISVVTPGDIMEHSDAIMAALRKIAPGMDGFTAKGHTLDVIDFDGSRTEEVAQALRSALHDAPFDVDIQTGHVSSELIENDSYDSHLQRAQPGHREALAEGLRRIGDRTQERVAEKARGRTDPTAGRTDPTLRRTDPTEAVTDPTADAAHHTALAQHAAKVTAKWSGAPDVVAVDRAGHGLPDGVSEHIAQAVPGTEPAAMYYGGKVYVFPHRIASKADLELHLAHEALGHYGLRRVFGEAPLNTLLDSIHSSIQGLPAFRRIAASYDKAYAGMDATARNRAFTEEYLSSRAELQANPSVLAKLTAFVRGWGRRLGMVRQWSDGDVTALMHHVAQNVRQGKTSRFGYDAPTTTFHGSEQAASTYRGAAGEGQVTYYPDGHRELAIGDVHASVASVLTDKGLALKVDELAHREPSDLLALTRFAGEENKAGVVWPARLADDLKAAGIPHEMVGEYAVSPASNVPAGAPRLSMRNPGSLKDDADLAARIKRTIAGREQDMTPWDRMQFFGRQLFNADNWRRARDVLMQANVDRFNQLRKVEMKLTGRVLDASESGFKMAHMSQHIQQVMGAVVRDGVPIYKDGAFQAGKGRKGWFDILSPIYQHPDPELESAFNFYLGTRRAERLLKETNADGTPRERNFTAADVAKGKELEAKYPFFKQVADDTQEFMNQILDLAVDRGNMRRETAEQWKENFYVPFYRAMEEPGMEAPGGGVPRGLKITSKYLSGGGQIENPLDSMLHNATQMLDKIYKNEAVRRNIAQAVLTGDAHPIGMAVDPKQFSVEEIEKRLEAAGLFVGRQANGQRGAKLTLTPADRAKWVNLMDLHPPVADDVVFAMQGGKAKYYRIDDPLLKRSIDNISREKALNKWAAAILGGPSKALRFLTVENPAFWIRHLFRQALDAKLQTSYPAKLFKHALSSAIDTYTNGPRLRQLSMAGAGGNEYYPIDQAHETMRGLSKHATLLDSAHKVWKAYEKIGFVADQMNRESLARTVLDNGGSVAEAAWQAQDLLNFGMHGDNVATRYLMRAVPFLNARTQGAYRIVRGATGQDVTASVAAKMGGHMARRFLMKGLLLTAASVALEAKNMNDPRYEKLSDEQKDLYYNFFVGDTHYALPKPFELGAIFSTLPARLLRLSAGVDNRREFFDSVARVAESTLRLDPRDVALVHPIMEDQMNKSSLTQRPIVSDRYEHVDPTEQFNAFTSPTIKAIAQNLPDSAPDMLRSPLRLQHLVNGYFSTIGQYTLDAADAVARAGNAAPAKPGSNSPLGAVGDAMLHSMVSKSSTDTHNSAEDVFWDNYHRLTEAADTITSMENNNELDRYNRYTARNATMIDMKDDMKDLHDALMDAHKAESEVYMDPSMSASEKRERLNDITRQKDEILKDYAPLLKAINDL